MAHLIRQIIPLACLLFVCVGRTFPPAPHHQLYGTVRNELGEPLRAISAEVIFESEDGVLLRSNIVNPNAEEINYRLAVPLDSGVTRGRSQATALRPWVGFRVHVRVGSQIYLPIEMRGDFSKLGQPAEVTRLNLTLGEDADGDGMPDAWERSFRNGTSDIEAGGDDDLDGISNLDEYLAGTYTLDPEEGYSLSMVGMRDDRPVLKFLGVPGRTYSIVGSSDTEDWMSVEFFLPDSDLPLESIRTDDVREIELEVDAAEYPIRIFRLLVE